MFCQLDEKLFRSDGRMDEKKMREFVKVSQPSSFVTFSINGR